MLPQFKTINVGENYSADNLQRIQNNVGITFDPLCKSPLIPCKQLTQVTLKSGLNTIQTGLGTILQGWFLTRLRANAVVYDAQDDNPTPKSTLLLVSSAEVVVDLIIY